MIDWEIDGQEIVNCNCDVGCPCQFNSLPTHGDCHASVAIEIHRGHFGDVVLDGMRAVAIMSWPAAIHMGHGKALIIVDERANEAQRNALLTILSGQETEPGATVFNVFAGTFEQVFEPVFKPIEIKIDVNSRKGSVRVEGMVETVGSPIINPVTGQEHRARIDLPHGFEYRVAEVAKGTTRTQGSIAMNLTDGHAHFARLHMNQSGIIG